MATLTDVENLAEAIAEQQALLTNQIIEAEQGVSANVSAITVELTRVVVEDTAVLVAADRVQTGLDVAATTANVVATALNVIAAESVRDAALIQAGVYVDEPTGRAAVADGVAFKVQGAGNVAAYEYRRVDSGSSTLIAEYPSSHAVYDAVIGVEEFKAELATDGGEKLFVGTGDVIPIITDKNDRIIFGYDESEEVLIGAGLGVTPTKLLLNDFGQAEFVGTSDVIPFFTDANNKVLFGYNKSTQKVIGAGLDFDSFIDDDVLNDYGFAEFHGDEVIPLFTDKNNRILLGYNESTETLIGAGLGGSSVTVNPLEPLTDLLGTAKNNHIISYGQSLSVGAKGTPVLSTSQPYSNITFQGGPRAFDGSVYLWTPFKALVEDAVSPAPDGGTARGETICSGLANYATTLRAIDGHLPSEHIILASAAGRGGTPIASLEQGSAWYNGTFLPHITQAHTIDSDHKVQVICWLQGESDNATSYATYYSKLNDLVYDMETDAKGITGQTTPVYTLMYQTAAYSLTVRDIQQAQLDVAKTNSRAFMVSPIYHLPHFGDALHLTNVGYKWLGAYFGRAYKQLLDGKKPKFLKPMGATRRGNELRIRFDVPYAPMTLDVTTLASTTDYGFAVEDTVGLITLDSVVIDNNDVIITLASTPVGATTVRYAMDYLGTGLSLTDGASGNLRDSDPTYITISSINRPLYNVAPHFELTVITLGE